MNVQDISGVESSAAVGDSMDITATVRNFGSEDGTYELRVDSEAGTIASTTVTVEGGSEAEVTVSPEFTAAGTYSVIMDGSVIETITVDAAEGTPESTPTTPTATTEPTTGTTAVDEGTTQPSTQPTQTTPSTPDQGTTWWPLLGAGALLVLVGWLLRNKRDTEETSAESDSQPPATEETE
jgi:LPXTG-motif cell wall-anchored protein